MKVYINNYRSHWLSPYTILEKIVFWREIDYREPAIELWANRLQPLCQGLQRIGQLVNPKIDYVKVDTWDTWSADYTLAQIILPTLKQLKEIKNGAPNVDDSDVPLALKSTSAPPPENEGNTDDNYFRRWDYVLDEMIWAFEQKVRDDAEGEFFDHSECVYTDDITADLNNNADRIKYDQKGHRAWQKRKENGFRLFGKYYEGLWW